MPSYNPSRIEPQWQAYWEANKTFRTPDPDSPEVAGKPKYYVLDMFPYPSGTGLHVGHPEGYTATDILARFKRMQGFHVLHPMGWDAFGLPAEQFAVEKNVHPRITTRQNIDTFRRQIKSLGFSYDWDREVDTTDPAYFRWTQWIFLLIYDTWYDAAARKGRPIAELPIPADVRAEGEDAVAAYRDAHRLAYQAEQPVNWCPKLGTVLANEEVIDGKSERGGYDVIRLPLRQWLMRITAYADRLIDDLEPLDWSESIKQMQRNWIGRSSGAEIRFPIAQAHAVTKGPSVTVFTTRPDTICGATYLVLAPEHPLVAEITTAEQSNAVTAYQQAAARKSDFERTELAKKKTGVFTGAYAVNPVNAERVPVWIADYVLAGYGTGAIMAVPAHDDRDFEFAKQFNLPIKTVVHPVDPPPGIGAGTQVLHVAAFTGEGIAMNSGFLNGLTTAAAKAKVTAWLETRLLGAARVNYKLRDWLFSRQRYWGEPFPVRHGLTPAGERDGTLHPLDPSELPLTLPDLADFKPTGTPDGPLAKATDWVTHEHDGRTYQRETNTMPQWAGSCWYYLRYIDPHNAGAFADGGKLRHWLPVDLYVGGAEHAVLHLLYSRFWHKVLFDRGYLDCPEPFHKLVNQGMILGEAEYHVPAAVAAERAADLAALGFTTLPVPKSDTAVLRTLAAEQVGNLTEEHVEKRQGKAFLKGTDIELTAKADKMSKARGNVVNPDDVVAEYGADSLRLYEMFMGPLEAVKPWSTRSVKGVSNFLGRVWRLIVEEAGDTPTPHPQLRDVPPSADVLRELHRTIQKVTDDTAGLRFNTAISAMMEYTNFLTKQEVRPRAAVEPFVKLLAPYAPHAAEELWRVLGHPETLAYEPWPAHDPALCAAPNVEIPVQVNGKVRAVLTVPAEIGDDELQAAALADPKVIDALGGKTLRKVVVKSGKLISLVV